MTINAESVPAHLNKGDALTLKGEYALAVESYERAASLRPDVSLSQLRIPLIVITSSGIMISDSGHRDHPP